MRYLIDSEGIISYTPRRDVAVSFSKAVAGEKKLLHIARDGCNPGN